MIEEFSQLKGIVELSEWLAGSPSRVAWFRKFSGLDAGQQNKRRKRDRDISATVQAELPLEGPAVYAVIHAHDSADAARVSATVEKETGACVYIKHVQTHVSEWARNTDTGEIVPIDRLPLYRKSAFYRHDGSCPRVRDEYWTDSRGVTIPLADQAQLETRFDPDSIPLSPPEDLPEHEPQFFDFGDHHKWWHRRHSVLNIDPTSDGISSEKQAELTALYIERRTARTKADSDYVLSRVGEAPKTAPIVDPVIEPKKRRKTEEELLSAREALRSEKAAKRAAWIASGQAEKDMAEIARLEKERAVHAAEMAELKVQRSIRRDIIALKKADGHGHYCDDSGRSFFATSAGSVSVRGRSFLANDYELSRRLYEDIRFLKEEIDNIDRRLRVLKKNL